MDLNISNKTQITSKNTRNIDFLKNREIWFRPISLVLTRHTPSSLLYLLSFYKTFDRNNQNLCL